MSAMADGRTHDVRFGWSRRLSVIHQSETGECALACLAMIATFHGHDTDLLALRKKGWESPNGASVSSLVRRAEALKLQARPLRVEISELSKLSLPCILHMELNHFVVLKRVTKKDVVVHDPAIGVRRIPLSKLSETFSGIAIELMPAADFAPIRERTRLSLRSLTGRVTGLKRALGVILAFALILELFALLAPLFVQVVVDQVITNRDMHLLTLLAVAFGSIIVLQSLIGAIRSWSLTRLGLNVNLAWMGNVFGHMMRLPDEYFRRRHLGDVVSRFGAIQVIQQTLTTRAIETVLDGIMAALTLAMLFFYNWKLALIALLAIVLYGASRAASYAMLREASLDQISAAARQETHFLEAVRASSLVRLHNQGALQTARYMNKATETVNKSAGIQSIELVFGTLNTIILGGLRVITVWFGATMTLSGALTAGMLVAFLAYNEQFTGRASRLIDFMVQFRLLRLQSERLADVVLNAPEQHVEAIYTDAIALPSIRCDGLFFRYSSEEPWIIRNCSFEIQPGESVAIVGASGCGKSTLVKLLSGLCEPNSGSISVGNIEMRHLGKERVRELTSVVMQDDQLLSGSIADNIALFDPSVDMKRVERAAATAGVAADIEQMPMRYQTLVGDMGSSLSGGQRQRVCLARALYREPKILLLDEATSHLDLPLEAEVSARVAKLNLTRIIIAHRPETIRSADRILVFANGTLNPLAPPASSTSFAPTASTGVAA